MTVIRRALSCLPLLSLLLGAAAQGQQPEADQQRGYIMGFLLVPWGADTSAVTRVYGRPLIARATDDGGLVLIYKDAALGKPILSLFYLNGSKGLVKGVSSIPFGPGNDCEMVMQRSKESIVRTYPALKPVEDRKQEDPKAPFCEAAAAGKASWTVSWTDPSSHNSVKIDLVPEESRVEVIYQWGAYQPPTQAAG